MRPAVLLLSAALLCGADGKPEATIIPVKHLTGDAFERLVKLLSVFGARFSSDETLRSIVVYSTPETNAEMKRVVEALDRPDSRAAIGRNIALMLTFLKCDPSGAAKPVPPGMESVFKQLRAANLCRSVEVWDTLPIRLQEGRQGEANSRLASSGPDVPPANVQIKVRADSIVAKDTGRYARFGMFNVGFRVPYATSVGPNSTQYQFVDVGINTSGDFKEGQKSVLGKITGSGDGGAVFVVVELQVLD